MTPAPRPSAPAPFELVSSNRASPSRLLALDAGEVLQQQRAQLDPPPARARRPGEACVRR